MRNSKYRCALFGHGVVGEVGIGVLREIGVEPVLVFAHPQGAGDWQAGLRPAAELQGVPCIEDADLSDPALVERLLALDLDIHVSLYFREMIPDAILGTARLGGVNLHGSPLPRYRGRAPVNWMVLNGESEGGAALHVMTSRPDGGPLLALRTFPIGLRDTAFSVLAQVERIGMDLIRECLPRYLAGGLTPTPQKGRGSYFGRRTPEDGRIDWTWPARRIYNLVRAVTRPYPGAFADIDGKRLYVWWAEEMPDRRLPPGTIVREGNRLLAGTGTGALHLVDCTVDGVPAGVGITPES